MIRDPNRIPERGVSTTVSTIVLLAVVSLIAGAIYWWRTDSMRRPARMSSAPAKHRPAAPPAAATAATTAAQAVSTSQTAAEAVESPQTRVRPIEILKNPGGYEASNVLLDLGQRPFMANEQVMTYVPVDDRRKGELFGYLPLRYKDQLDQRVAVFEVVGIDAFSGKNFVAGEILVSHAPESELDLTKDWIVQPGGTREVRVSNGASAQLPIVRFCSYTNEGAGPAPASQQPETQSGPEITSSDSNASTVILPSHPRPMSERNRKALERLKELQQTRPGA